MYKKNKKVLITDKYWPESVLTDKPFKLSLILTVDAISLNYAAFSVSQQNTVLVIWNKNCRMQTVNIATGQKG